MISVMTSRLISRTQEEKINIFNASFDSNDVINASLSFSFDANKKHRKRGTNNYYSIMNIKKSYYDDLKSIATTNHNTKLNENKIKK